MSSDRDVAAFDRRAASYDEGRLGAWHEDIVLKVSAVVQRAAPEVVHAVVDVGCGTGLLLAQLRARLGAQVRLLGIDPAPGMVAQAARRAQGRFDVAVGAAEALPIPDGSVDVAVACLSFDHWADQEAGLKECARVLRPGGTLVVADLFAAWLGVTTIAGRSRRRVRTPRVMQSLCVRAGLEPLVWQQLQRAGFLPIIQVIVADRPVPDWMRTR